jgi:hypothetical protein
MNQPMDKSDLLCFVNDLIDGTKYQDMLISLKDKLKISQLAEKYVKVGKGYYSGFMKRYRHLLVSKKGRRFALNRSEWMHPKYIKQMYENIYDILVDARVAQKLENYDFEGNIVPIGSDKQYGFPSDIYIPPENRDLFFFCDETGINTCQRNDGHNGGKKYIVPPEMQPLLGANTTDHRASVLPIVSARGDLVLLAVVFMSDSAEVPALWASGIDVTVDPITTEDGNVDVFNKENHGPGNYLPGATVCEYRGKKVPTQFYTSPKGSITGEILVQILEFLDSRDLFERRPDGPEPCILLDGHESRLKPSFLKYINNPNHKWHVGVGVPYLTHLWQVGDASELNGSFKIQFQKAKEQLMEFKRYFGMKARLHPEDIVPCLNKAVELSFSKSESNRKAIAERGWYPPNMKLLDDHRLRDLEDMANQNATESCNDELIGTVNLTNGACAKRLKQIVDHSKRKEGIETSGNSIAERHEELKAGLKKASSGVVFKSARSCLNNPELIEGVLERDARIEKEKQEKRGREKQRIRKLKEKVALIRSKKGDDFNKWNKEELKSFLQYKKKPGDAAMPTSLPDLRARARQHEEENRRSPIPSPSNSVCGDDNYSIAEESDIGFEEGHSMQI